MKIINQPLLIFLGSCFFLPFLNSCNSNKTFDSPDKRFSALTSEDVKGMLVVEIVNSENETIFKHNTKASTFHKWSLTWQDNNKILVRTSDIGPTSLIRNDTGNWYVDDPLRQISPDGKTVVYTFWGNYNKRLLTVAIMKADGNEKEASSIIKQFKTDITISQLEDCISWTDNNMFTVKADDGVYAWELDKTGEWNLEEK